jgi:AraC-like DNA-binding protein
LNLRGAVVEKQNAAALTAFIEKTMQFYEEGKTETEFEESLRVYEILRYLHGGSAQDAGRASYIDQVTAYINENIGRRITLEELAETASLSSFHFSRRFKRDTGYSPVEYVNHKKLDYAKTLLIRTEWPVTEIAERTGFSLKGFIKLFSQTEGMPPLAWRRSRQMDMNKPEKKTEHVSRNSDELKI